MAGAEALTGAVLDRCFFLALTAAAPRRRTRLIVNALDGLSNPNDVEEGQQVQRRFEENSLPLAAMQNICGVVMLLNAAILIRWFRGRVRAEEGTWA